MAGTVWKRLAVFLAAGLAAVAVFLFLIRFDNKYTMSGTLTQDGALVADRTIFEKNGLIWAAASAAMAWGEPRAGG